MRRLLRWTIETTLFDWLGAKIPLYSAITCGGVSAAGTAVGLDILGAIFPYALIGAPIAFIGVTAGYYYVLRPILPPPFGGALQIRFCDDKDMIVDAIPTAHFWEPSHNLVSFRVSWPSVKITNRTNKPLTIDRAWFALKAKGREIARRDCPELVGLRLQGNDTNSSCIEVFRASSFGIESRELEDIVGRKYQNARIELMVRSDNKAGMIRFKTERLAR